MEKKDQNETTQNTGDDCTPDKTIGQIAYADRPKQTPEKKRSDGEPQVTPMEPEKQGGIGGP